VSSNNQRNRKKSIRRPPPGKLKIDSGINDNTQSGDNFGFQKQFYSDEQKQGGNYESANAQDYYQDNLY
jgi:hypothetical protein